MLASSLAQYARRAGEKSSAVQRCEASDASTMMQLAGRALRLRALFSFFLLAFGSFFRRSRDTRGYLRDVGVGMRGTLGEATVKFFSFRAFDASGARAWMWVTMCGERCCLCARLKKI